MVLMAYIYIIILLFSTLFSYCLAKKDKIKYKKMAELPPGSMGWPYIGQTLQLYSQDPNVFFSAKQNRYGDIFKTHVLGCPCIMLASPEAARFVLVKRPEWFKPTYPKSKEKLIGPSALFFHQGEYHTVLRKLIQRSLSPEAIRRLVPDIEAIATSALESCAGGHVISTFQHMKKFSFEVGNLSIFGRLSKKYKQELQENYCVVNEGYNSYPTNLPGTAYRRAILARGRITLILREMISERKEMELFESDLLGHLLNFENENGQKLSDDQIADNIIGVLFAAQDTTASVLTWILKYLRDNQKLLEAVKAEQQAIFNANKEEKRSLTWEQTRNMPLTYRVILESLRMASIISFTFREAVVDVEYEGYLIPKGWKVMPLFRSIHQNPEFFSNPQDFDPARFEVAPKPNTFMPFGNGVHACPGNELAKLEMLILIHHLMNKFRWELVGSSNDIQYNPFPVPQHGLLARFWKETEGQVSL